MTSCLTDSNEIVYQLLLHKFSSSVLGLLGGLFLCSHTRYTTLTTAYTLKSNMLDSLVKNIYINLTAYLSTFGLALMQFLSFLDGVLPTISLLLTTIGAAILLYFNTKIKSSEAELKDLQIEKLRKELNGGD